MKKYICNPVMFSPNIKVDTGGRQAGLGYGMGRFPVPHGGFGDPAVVRFKGRYYVFGSFSGFWWSDDLTNWYQESGAGLGIMPGAAGDSCQIGDYLYHSASNRDKCFYTRTKDPMSREFEHVSDPPFAYWDPALFQDDDGRVYLFWGCNNYDPIYGIEMNPETMMPIGERVALFGDNSDHHGFERNGWNNDRSVGMLREGETDGPGLDYPAPWIEGSFMTKHDGKYYLQYACPATELPVYCDGVYVADKPLGPYTFCPNSPFSTVRGGFYEGAGHGSTFQDEYGNYWHASTMIGASSASNRKMGLFPLGFDKDGVMFCDQRFADYPYYVPTGKTDPTSLFTGWMLLSYKKPVTASSEIDTHPAANVANESSRSYWAASRRYPGEWIMMDLEKVSDVRAIQLNFCDHELTSLLNIPYNHFSTLPPEEQVCRHRWLLEGSVDGENWEVLVDKREADTDIIHDLLVFEDGKSVRYLRLTSFETPFFGNFAMTGLRVFGHVEGKTPAAAQNVVVERDAADPCTVTMRWEPSEGAVGYNVLWGIAEDKLYHSTLVYGKNELVMHCLNDDVPYFIQVDAFNESGITEGTVKAAQ